MKLSKIQLLTLLGMMTQMSDNTGWIHEEEFPQDAEIKWTVLVRPNDSANLLNLVNNFLSILGILNEDIKRDAFRDSLVADAFAKSAKNDSLFEELVDFEDLVNFFLNTHYLAYEVLSRGSHKFEYSLIHMNDLPELTLSYTVLLQRSQDFAKLLLKRLFTEYDNLPEVE